MTEPQIRDYLLGRISPGKLQDVNKMTDGKVRSYHQEVEMIQKGEFLIEPQHLISVCDDVLKGRMKPETLDLFSFILMGSDYFIWNSESAEGQRISDVIFEWSNPSVNYPLTIENVVEWKKYLQGHQRTMQR